MDGQTKVGDHWKISGYFCPKPPEDGQTWVVSVNADDTVYYYYGPLGSKDIKDHGLQWSWTTEVPDVPDFSIQSVRFLGGPACGMALLQQGTQTNKTSGVHTAVKMAVDTVCDEHQPKPPYVPFPGH